MNETTTTKHTPGEWFFIEEDVEARAVIRTNATPTSHGRQIALLCDTEWLEPEDIANARLIAAAPDGHEALALYRSISNVWDDARRRVMWAEADAKADAYFAKARGES